MRVITRHIEGLLLSGENTIGNILVFCIFFIPVIGIFHFLLYRKFYRSFLIAGSIMGYETLIYMLIDALIFPPVLASHILITPYYFNLILTSVLIYKNLCSLTVIQNLLARTPMVVSVTLKILMFTLSCAVIMILSSYFATYIVQLDVQLLYDSF